MKRTPLRRTGNLKRSRINPVNRSRKAARKKITDGPQSQLCRESPCCVPGCGWVPYGGHPTHPHHCPTVANGGTDSDTSPLCPPHHDAFHSQCGGRQAFLDRFEVDVVEEARLLDEQLKENGD